MLPGVTPHCCPKYCYIIVHQHNTDGEMKQSDRKGEDVSFLSSLLIEVREDGRWERGMYG